MKQLFIWFYCLPMDGSFLLMVLFSLLLLLLRSQFGSRTAFRGFCLLGLALWACGIFYLTIGSRSGGDAVGYQMVPFHSYREVLEGGNPEILRSNFMNVLLFYPAGLLAAACLPERNRTLLWILAAAVFLLVSAAVEYTQFSARLGTAEIDDVLHNTLGAALGLGIGLSITKSS